MQVRIDVAILHAEQWNHLPPNVPWSALQPRVRGTWRACFTVANLNQIKIPLSHFVPTSCITRKEHVSFYERRTQGDETSGQKTRLRQATEANLFRVGLFHDVTEMLPARLHHLTCSYRRLVRQFSILRICNVPKLNRLLFWKWCTFEIWSINERWDRKKSSNLESAGDCQHPLYLNSTVQSSWRAFRNRGRFIPLYSFLRNTRFTKLFFSFSVTQL